MIELLSACIFMAVLCCFTFFAGSLTENCFSWALRQRIFKGGKLLYRRSHFADELLPAEYRNGVGYWLAKQVPHFAWADRNGVIWQYTVRDCWREYWNGQSLFFAWLSLWYYDGEVVKGDPVLGERWEH